MAAVCYYALCGERSCCTGGRKNEDSLAEDEWYGHSLFQSTVSTTHVVRDSAFVHPHTTKMSWSSQWLHKTTFFRSLQSKKPGFVSITKFFSRTTL